MLRVTPIPNSSDKNTAGSISPDLSATMMEIPITAITMDIQVAIRTFSLRQIHPRTAVINGAVAKRSIVSATEVVWIA